ncbi:hypothetical protein CAURIC_04580 [Corynebacterium auriscanis]|nr:hypothetical protein CAURIC_04580 [Corynebacterium auriscanis]
MRQRACEGCPRRGCRLLHSSPTTVLPADYCIVHRLLCCLPAVALPADNCAACQLPRNAALPAVGSVVVHVIVGRVLAKLPLDEKHHQDG